MTDNASNKKTYFNFRKEIRKKLFERDGYKCFYTGRLLTGIPATIEHLIPLSKGGKNNLDNLVLCTKESNQLMADKPLIEKLKYREANLFNEGSIIMNKKLAKKAENETE